MRVVHARTRNPTARKPSKEGALVRELCQSSCGPVAVNRAHALGQQVAHGGAGVPVHELVLPEERQEGRRRRGGGTLRAAYCSPCRPLFACVIRGQPKTSSTSRVEQSGLEQGRGNGERTYIGDDGGRGVVRGPCSVHHHHAEPLAKAQIVEVFLALRLAVAAIVGEVFELRLVLASRGELNSNRIACGDSAEDAGQWRGFGIGERDGSALNEDQIAAPGHCARQGRGGGVHVELGCAPIVAYRIEECVEGLQALGLQRNAQVAPKRKSGELRIVARAALDSQAVESMESELRSLLSILDGQAPEKGSES